jgi:hypothetical protein
MQPEQRAEAAIIPIDVARQSQGLFLTGTFSQPPALVRVRQNTNVQWQLSKVDPNDTFIVSFPHGSPFEDLSAISDRTAALAAVNKGDFHYQVFVTAGATGDVFAVHNCPEIQVVGGDDD